MDDKPTFAEQIADALGYLRYGMPTAKKEAMAASGALPGAPPDPTVDQDVANRYASGYLFAQQHPQIAPLVQPLVDRMRTAWFGDSPELQSYATAGMNRGLLGGSR